MRSISRGRARSVERDICKSIIYYEHIMHSNMWINDQRIELDWKPWVLRFEANIQIDFFHLSKS